MKKIHMAGFALLEVSYWSFHASFLAYLSAYLISKGVSNTMVSLLLSAFLLSAFAGSLFWGSYCDRRQTNRKPFFISAAATAVLMFVIYFLAESHLVLAVCYPLLGFFFQPQGANADAWLLAACRRDQRIFGRIRSMPSLAYAFVCAFVGQIIKRFGYQAMLFSGSFFLILVFVSVSMLPDIKTEGAQKAGRISRENLARLFKSRPYRLLVIVLFFVGLAVAPFNNLKIVVYESVGGNVSHIGLDSFVGALTQVPFIAMAGLTQRLPLRGRYLAMSAFPMIMLLMARFALSPSMLIAGNFFYNIGYGFLLPTMRNVTETYVDKDVRNLGHNLTDTVFNSFSGVVSLIYAGAITDMFGVGTMLSVCLATALVPLAVSCLSRKME